MWSLLSWSWTAWQDLCIPSRILERFHADQTRFLLDLISSCHLFDSAEICLLASSNFTVFFFLFFLYICSHALKSLLGYNVMCGRTHYRWNAYVFGVIWISFWMSSLIMITLLHMLHIWVERVEDMKENWTCSWFYSEQFISLSIHCLFFLFKLSL